MSHIHLTITSSEVDKRLDHILMQQCKDISRSKIQKAVKEGHIKVNNKKVPPHYFLRLGDVVTGELQVEQKDIQITANKDIHVKVIFENKDFAVIEKPAGLIAHQSDIHPEPDTLVNGLLAKYPDIKNVGDNPMRPGIVHRLDKDVSGLMAIALTQEMFAYLKKQFQQGAVYKEYIGVARGLFSHKTGEIDLPITRSKNAGHKMAARTDGTGKPAKTSYAVLREGAQHSLVRLILHTGRTHQIRVHLNAVAHPLLGDNTYTPHTIKNNDFGRVLLHAVKLEFVDLQGQKHTFTSEYPDRWEKLL